LFKEISEDLHWAGFSAAQCKCFVDKCNEKREKFEPPPTTTTTTTTTEPTTSTIKNRGAGFEGGKATVKGWVILLGVVVANLRLL